MELDSDPRRRCGASGCGAGWSRLGEILLTLAVPLALGYLALIAWYASGWAAGLVHLDFFLRWQEIQYVLAGVDPRDVRLGLSPALPEVGVPPFSYAPWSYLLALPFLPPLHAGAALTWFASASFIALAWVALRQWRAGRVLGARRAALLCAASLASLAIPVGFRHLNYSILVCAAIAAFVQLVESDRRVLAGVALAFTMLKPQLGALFFLVPLVRGAWLTLSVATGLLGASLLSACALVGKGPVALTLAMFHEGAAYQDAYLGLFNGLERVGVGRGAIQLAGLVAGASSCLWLLWRFRPPVGDAVAVAACFSTLWGYHRTFDLAVIGFLVVALGARSLETGDGRLSRAFVVVLLAYWFPPLARWSQWPVLPELVRLAWLFGVLELLASRRRLGGQLGAGGACLLPGAVASP